LIGLTLLIEKLGRFHQLSASFRKVSMGVPAQGCGSIVRIPTF
jgi:chromosome partitioning protein